MPSHLPATVYLSAADVIRLVQRVGLPKCIAEVAVRIERDFLRWREFDKSARVACHSRDGVIELMPIADTREFAFKYVNGHPKNTRDGLPTVMAFGMLADVATGAPRLLSELTLTTAIRTAAMSAVAARVLARPDSRTMALIGNGAQSEFQALAFRDLVGIRTLRVCDIDPAATAKLVANLRDEALEIRVCRDAAEAADGADIVTTVTADKANATIVTPDMIAPGLHVNAVGGDCPGKTELHADVLTRGKVFVEYEPQTRIEGDIQQMAPDFPAVELWQVLAGRARGRETAADITIFDSVGFALEDYSALTFVRDAAAALGIGDVVELIPAADDPKNLFGLLRRQTSGARAALALP
ncbi:ornithine cyclodeaminase [Burkholderia oklahomensis]|uniref:Ornithine cyclodeaminase n=1 Tax=Burkholderia oklahomensis TaxID=342113 RepID=A0AAI8BEB6_9BURK|nr:ornithine cyclodeaminase [Burkholderia oklahomensis]AIO70434.1 ornithine cyclodeaminase [Burkholderia oklahomensis]AOI39227.1 ornithine cyclodeaminase [Burkholderia oklahomensis EO147]KUY51717.1 ornithine cyclodeaminase [Burkholderia oklahomensis EO147]QPS40419.1 ornithine cyclodeaminase [Burkholderia oklahomensis]